MLSRNLQSLKVSLIDAMETWIEKNSEEDGWGELGWFGDNTAELMADSAFNVLLTTKNVNDYLDSQDMLKKPK